MLIVLYLGVVGLAFLFLILGLYNGSYGAKVAIQNGSSIEYDSKQLLTVIFLGLSSLFFIVAALNSLTVTQEICELDSTDAWKCTERRYPDQALTGIFGFLVIFDWILAIIYWSKDTMTGLMQK